MDPTTAVLLTFLLMIAALAAAVGVIVRRPEPEPPATEHPLLGEMVVVNTHKPDDQSLQGILVSADAGWIVLRAPSHLEVRGGTATWQRLPADAVIPERTVSWIVAVPADPKELAKVPAEAAAG